MFRRLCGGVKCNNAPVAAPPRTRFNNVKNYLSKFDPNFIKVENGASWPGAKVLQVSMYVNGKKAGYVQVAIGPSKAEIIEGKTYGNYRSQQLGRILRALVTKGVINVGKYNKITHEGANLEGMIKPNNKNRRPISTRIVRNHLGFKPNTMNPNQSSLFKLGNNISLVNKVLKNYKNGVIGPRRRTV